MKKRKIFSKIFLIRLYFLSPNLIFLKTGTSFVTLYFSNSFPTDLSLGYFIQILLWVDTKLRLLFKSRNLDLIDSGFTNTHIYSGQLNISNFAFMLLYLT